MKNNNTKRGCLLLIYVVIPLTQPNRCTNSQGQALKKAGAKVTAAEAEAIFIEVGLEVLLRQTIDYNKTLGTKATADALKKIYGIEYPYYEEYVDFDFGRVYRNLSSGYPLYGGFEDYTNNQEIVKHMVVIRGITPTANRIYLMDPQVGFTTANYSGKECNYVSAQGTQRSLTYNTYISKK